MYAEHRYAPRQSRTVSLGAALLINGALIAGLAFSVPQFVKGEGPTTMPIREYRDPPIPPLEKPKPQPKAEHPAPDNRIPTAPDPEIKTETDNLTKTTPTIPDRPLPPLPPQPGASDGGTGATEATPPLPPLLGASQDSRYLRDFQPPYPSAELRAQRDGLVSLNVLIGIDGRVKDVQSLSATSDAFFEAARRQALSKWRFKPATRGGVPQESWKKMTVRFLIKDQ